VRILVVEDDPKISQFVVAALKQAGFAVDCAQSGDDGLQLALSTPYDAAVVDVMLPGLSGLELIGELRSRKVTNPVIILSARRSVDDRVTGLLRGGDDYLTKPFSISELLARIHALVRRSTNTAEPTLLTVADLVLDLQARKVTRGGQHLNLQAREFSLLELLVRNVDRPVSKTMILERLWDYSFDPQTNVVDVLVCRLRTKLDRGFADKMIHTIRGVGYVIKNP
jgi:two-component system, OmpR family, response regulator